MNITVSTQGHIAVAAISGEITHAVSGELQERLLGALQASQALVLDCSGVALLTSAGLRTLLLLHRQARGGGKPLILVAVPASVRDVMAVTGFWEQFEACDTLGDALAAIPGSRP